MELESRVDALEHLLGAVLKNSSMTLLKGKVFDDANASIMGSNGPGGTGQKTAALEALDYIRKQLTE